MSMTYTITPTTINDWIVLHLSDEISATLPSRGQVMTKGTLNGVPFHMPAEPDGKGGHWLEIDTQLQTRAHVRAGSAATLIIEPTKDWPEPKVPVDLQAALDAQPLIKKLWLDVTPMARWEWLRWINSTKQPETRARRIEVSCSKLQNGLRRPCCFNRSMCCVPDVSKNGVLLEPTVMAS